MSNDVNEMSVSSHHGVPTGELVTLLYEELKLLAQARMARERLGHTLTATALVNEAMLRLLNQRRLWPGRKLFFFAAAEAMKRVLIDHARRRSARDGGRRVMLPDGAELAVAEPGIDVPALEEHLAVLRRVDAEAYEVVQLRYFAGLSVEETADLLGVDRRSVARRWAAARAWLADRFNRDA